MSITDELREYAQIAFDKGSAGRARFEAIADSIDREHRMALEKVAAEADEDAMEEHGWVKLPVDTDGTPIRPGDALVIFETGEYIRAYDIELYDDGQWRVGDYETMDSIHPDRLRHHHAPTVEDVLHEFAECVRGQNEDFTALLVSEYASKLRMAEEVDE